MYDPHHAPDMLWTITAMVALWVVMINIGGEVIAYLLKHLFLRCLLWAKGAKPSVQEVEHMPYEDGLVFVVFPGVVAPADLEEIDGLAVLAEPNLVQVIAARHSNEAVLVPYDSELLFQMEQARVPFFHLRPDPKLREEFIAMAKQRGVDPSLVQPAEDHWDDLHEALREYLGITLDLDDKIADVLAWFLDVRDVVAYGRRSHV